jgi:hypothetical protein
MNRLAQDASFTCGVSSRKIFSNFGEYTTHYVQKHQLLARGIFGALFMIFFNTTRVELLRLQQTASMRFHRGQSSSAEYAEYSSLHRGNNLNLKQHLFRQE